MNFRTNILLLVVGLLGLPAGAQTDVPADLMPPTNAPASYITTQTTNINGVLWTEVFTNGQLKGMRVVPAPQPLPECRWVFYGVCSNRCTINGMGLGTNNNFWLQCFVPVSLAVQGSCGSNWMDELCITGSCLFYASVTDNCPLKYFRLKAAFQ